MTEKKTARVLVVPLNKQPEVQEIVPDLETLQALVDGYIEIVPYGSNGVDLVCNEEGKYNGQEPNRAVWGGKDVIFGQFVLLRHDDEGNCVGLSEQDIARFKKEFALPC